jgi:hypothetical protein
MLSSKHRRQCSNLRRLDVLTWFNRTNPVCDAGFSVSRKEIERRRSEVVEIAMAMTAALASVVLWDPLPILCSQQECSALDQSGPLFSTAII